MRTTNYDIRMRKMNTQGHNIKILDRPKINGTVYDGNHQKGEKKKHVD